MRNLSEDFGSFGQALTKHTDAIAMPFVHGEKLSGSVTRVSALDASVIHAVQGSIPLGSSLGAGIRRSWPFSNCVVLPSTLLVTDLAGSELTIEFVSWYDSASVVELSRFSLFSTAMLGNVCEREVCVDQLRSGKGSAIKISSRG